MSMPPDASVRATPLGHAVSFAATLPFDAARELYALLVRFGFVESSLLGSARFGRRLNNLEKLVLGPWARQV